VGDGSTPCDLGYRDQGGYFFLVDRAKDMIISAGNNIYAREVEEALLTHPAVLEVAVIGRPDAYWGESVHAVVVLRSGAIAGERELDRPRPRPDRLLQEAEDHRLRRRAAEELLWEGAQDGPQRGSLKSTLIVDSDAGIDDALAVLYLVRSPDAEVLAVGSVHGNVPSEIAARNLLRTLEIAGLDVPVALVRSSADGASL